MKENFPINSDPLMGFHQITAYTPYNDPYLSYLENYPVATEKELLTHYAYGNAGPFVDLLVYIDLGVGWTFKPVDFEDEASGTEAARIIEEELFKRDFSATMMQFATYYYVLGRAALIKTYNGLDEFYYDEKSKVNGIDCINPMTLTPKSIREVMEDTTGTKEFVQKVRNTESYFSQDRIIYRANNPFNKYSLMGFSNLQRCVSELRLLSRFPRYRENLARKYSNLHRIFEVDTEKFGQTTRGKSILNDAIQSQEYINDMQSYYSRLEEKGSSLFFYDWVKVKESSYAGKEVKLNDLEVQTLHNIAFKLDIPLDLLMYTQTVNRSVMEVLTDIFVNKQGAGTRKYLYTPIIEGVANELLLQHDITGGRLEVEYNPFLSKNLMEMAGIIRDVWPTGSITINEVRNRLDLPLLSDEELEENRNPSKESGESGESGEL